MTEPDAGSDIAGFKTRATCRADGTWVLNGQKTYISFGLIAELFFDDVELTPLHVIGDPARGFDYMRDGLAEERLGAATQSLPFAGEAIRLAIEFTTGRKAFGKHVSDFQNTKFKLAELRVEVDATQALLDHCVRLHNAGKLDPATAAVVKLKASEVQARAVDESLQLHGSAGYMREYPICQLYADSRISRIFAGSSEIMKVVIAKDMLDS